MNERIHEIRGAEMTTKQPKFILYIELKPIITMFGKKENFHSKRERILLLCIDHFNI